MGAITQYVIIGFLLFLLYSFVRWFMDRNSNRKVEKSDSEAVTRDLTEDYNNLQEFYQD